MSRGAPHIHLLALYPACVHYLSPAVPPQPHARHELPHSLGILTASLRQNGVDVDLIDLLTITDRRMYLQFLDLMKHPERVERYLRGEGDDPHIKVLRDVLVKAFILRLPSRGLFGMSVMGYGQFLLAVLLAEGIKQRLKDVSIVLGGAFMTLRGEALLEDFPQVDFVVQGSGVDGMLALAKAFFEGEEPSDIPGLLVQGEGGSSEGMAPSCCPIEQEPVPEFDAPVMTRYKAVKGGGASLYYSLSSGCPYQCAFCVHSSVQPRYERKSPGKAVADLKEMKERYAINNFILSDSTFNVDKQYVVGFCEELLSKEVAVNWQVNMRPDVYDIPMLKIVKRAGCFSVQVGAESGSDRILQAMNKGVKPEQMARFLSEAHEVGLDNKITLIAGFPHERPEDVDATLAFVEQNARFIYSVTQVRAFMLLSGTPMFRDPERFGVRVREPINGIFGDVYYGFDEIGGMSWEEKKCQQDRSARKVLEAVYRNVMVPKTPKPLAWIPFSVFFLLRNTLLGMPACSAAFNDQRLLKGNMGAPDGTE